MLLCIFGINKIPSRGPPLSSSAESAEPRRALASHDRQDLKLSLSPRITTLRNRCVIAGCIIVARLLNAL